MMNQLGLSDNQRQDAMKAHADELAAHAKEHANDPLPSSEGERNCLSYWFPKLVAAGVPVPRTEIVRTDCRLEKLLDGKTPEGWEKFLTALQDAADRIGLAPWFLRTGQGSGKHQWRDTAYVRYPGELQGHVAALVEWSMCVDFLGLSYDVWAVRELLPVRPAAVLPAYGDMPLVREIRAFVRGGHVVCCHPYWPADAIRQGFGMHFSGPPHPTNPLAELEGPKTWRAGRFPVPDNLDDVIRATFLPMYLTGWADLLDRVAVAFADDGAWSVDVLETDRGWFVTDMAEAHRSFHWEGCDRARELKGAAA